MDLAVLIVHSKIEKLNLASKRLDPAKILSKNEQRVLDGVPTLDFCPATVNFEQPASDHVVKAALKIGCRLKERLPITHHYALKLSHPLDLVPPQLPQPLRLISQRI